MKQRGRKSEIGVYADDLFLWKAQGLTHKVILDKLEKKSGRLFHKITLSRFYGKFEKEIEIAARLEVGRGIIESNRKGLTSLHKLDLLIDKYEKKLEDAWENLKPKSLEANMAAYAKLLDLRSKITGEQKTAGNINISFGNDVHAKAFSKYVRRYVESKGDSFEKFLVAFHRYLKDEHSDIIGMEEEREEGSIDVEVTEVEEEGV